MILQIITVNTLLFITVSNAEPYHSELIAKIRKKILAEHSADPKLYHQSDIDRLTASDWYIERFIRKNGGKDRESAEEVTNLLRFRKDKAINEISDDVIPAEIYATRGMVFVPTVDGQQACAGSMANNYPIPALFDTKVKYYYQIYDRIEVTSSANESAKFDLWIRMENASIANFDYRDAKVIAELMTIIPGYPRQAIVTGLNAFTEAVFKLVKYALPENVRSILTFPKDVSKYIDLSQSPTWLGGAKRGAKIVPDVSRSGRCLPHLKHIEPKVWDEFYEKNMPLLSGTTADANVPDLKQFFKC